jgi:hypothetical protein
MGGSSGGYEKQKISTKEQDKGIKSALKEFEKGKGLRKESRNQLEKLMEGKYLPETDLKKLGKDFQKAYGDVYHLLRDKYKVKDYDFVEDIFEPQLKTMEKEARKGFERYTVPETLSQYGADAKSSSALNQALAAAGKDLQLGLAGLRAQSIPQQAQYGLEQARLNEQQRQFGAGLLADQRSQSLAYGQGLLGMSQQNIGTGLQSRLASASTGLGQGYQPLQTGISAQPYALTPRPTPFWQSLLLAGAEGAGAAGTKMALG